MKLKKASDLSFSFHSDGDQVPRGLHSSEVTRPVGRMSASSPVPVTPETRTPDPLPGGDQFPVGSDLPNFGPWPLVQALMPASQGHE